MSVLYGPAVEFGLHCILWLIGQDGRSISSRDLAEFQGASPSVLGKIMPKMEKAGLVVSNSGINGGYRLGRSPDQITVLDVVEAIEGRSAIFECRDVRRGCVLIRSDPPEWITGGVCGIHAVMLRAEEAMRSELARTTIMDLARGFKTPPGFGEEVASWFAERGVAREASRTDAVRKSVLRRREDTD